MATTFEVQIDHAAPASLAERFAEWATNASKPLQLSQMIRALAQLNDEQLQHIGLKRSEIPAHAHKIIYYGK